MLSKLFYLLIAGALGGLLGWMVLEPFQAREISMSIQPNEISDGFGLARKLQSGDDPISQFIRSRVTESKLNDINSALTANNRVGVNNALANLLNELIKGESIYSSERFANVKLSSETRSIIGKDPRLQITEKLNRYLLTDAYPQHLNKPSGSGSALNLGLVLGVFIGGLLGLASGWSKGTLYHAGKSAGIGIITGAIGGLIGMHLAGLLFSALGGKIDTSLMSFGEYVFQLFARGFAFCVFGAVLGAGYGLPTRSMRRVYQGMLGGAVGGFLGGFLMNIIGDLTLPLQQALDPGKFASGVAEIGIFSRAITFTLIGAAIGFFVGLIEIIAKQAWIRVEMGRNEGKEYLIDAAISTIGRSEGADVPLFGDLMVAPNHARIIKQDSIYNIVAEGRNEVSVNGTRVQQARIKDGDRIRIGNFNLLFCEREGAAKKAKDLKKQTIRPIPTAPGACPYCGLMKDAMGNCGCTVGGVSQSPVAGQPPQPPAQVPYPSQPPSPISGASVLTVMSGPFSGARLAPGNIIGRNTLNPTDATISRNHAQLIIEGGALVICDAGSTNGVLVNGVRITKQTLNIGDTVQIGQVYLRAE